MLEPIDPSSPREALAILARGFPHEEESTWRFALDGAAMTSSMGHGWPPGFLLRHGGRVVGVLLTFASRRPDRAGKPITIVNLSSWYVDPEDRALAPFMLARVLARGADVFTDLTPTKHVRSILLRLGFTPWNEGFIVCSWPQSLVAGSEPASVRHPSAVPNGELDAADRAMLADHERLGCVVAALHTRDSWQPLVFRKKRMRRSRRLRHIPCAYLMFARDRAAVLRYRRAVTWYLLCRGLPILCVDGDRNDCPSDCNFQPGRRKFFRGEGLGDIDFAYSEEIFIELD